MGIILDDTNTKYQVTAYVRGSKEERQRQKDEIQTALCHKLPEGDFVSDWRVVERRLTETEQNSKFMLVVADLRVLSEDPKAWAERAIVFVKPGVSLWPVNNEQRARWDSNCRAVGGMDEKSILTFLEKQYRGLIEEEAERQ